MSQIIKIARGDTSDVMLTRPDVPGLANALDVNWVCKQSVLDCDGVVVVAAAVVTSKSVDEHGHERFVVAVEPADSDLLTVPAGEPYMEYDWVIQLENTTTTPPYNKEHRITLRVREQGIP